MLGEKLGEEALSGFPLLIVPLDMTSMLIVFKHVRCVSGVVMSVPFPGKKNVSIGTMPNNAFVIDSTCKSP